MAKPHRRLQSSATLKWKKISTTKRSQSHCLRQQVRVSPSLTLGLAMHFSHIPWNFLSDTQNARLRPTMLIILWGLKKSLTILKSSRDVQADQWYKALLWMSLWYGDIWCIWGFAPPNEAWSYPEINLDPVSPCVSPEVMLQKVPKKACSHLWVGHQPCKWCRTRCGECRQRTEVPRDGSQTAWSTPGSLVGVSDLDLHISTTLEAWEILG